MAVFRMPSLGADMDSGTLIEWLVAPGDAVHRGDVVAVVDTAKSAIDVEVFTDGVIAELLVQPGTEVPVGTPLATIEEAPAAAAVGDRAAAVGAATGSDAGTELVDGGKAAAVGAAGAAADAGAAAADAGGAADAGAAVVSPAAVAPPLRHLAHLLGVDMESVSGSGPGGRITRQDVERAAGAAVVPPPAATATGGAPPAPPAEARVRATPRARRMAESQGVDLAAVAGTGADGAVTADDVIRAAHRAEADRSRTAGAGAGQPEPGSQPAPQAPPPGPDAEPREAAAGAGDAGPGAVAPRSGDERRAARRAATAALMGRAAREIPHYYVTTTLDVSAALEWLRDHNADRRPRDRVLPAALFLRATAVAATQVPVLNGHWIDDGFVASPGVHLGVAVAVRGGGLVTPAIRDAQELRLDDLMVALTDLVGRARSGRLRGRELEPGSITVSSLADGGPDALYGVIYPPQVAVVGIGGIAERPWAVSGMLTVRRTVTITLGADHRASDGRVGARFLSAFESALNQPEGL